MKILMLGSGSYKSSLTYFRLVALGQELAKLDWQVSLIVPSADKYNDFKKEPDAKLEGIELIQPWQFTTRSALVNLVPYMFSGLAATLRVRAELIYLYKPTPITIIGLVPKFLLRTPVILDLDDLGSEVMRQEKLSKFQVSLVAACERLALRYASAVVVTSSYLEQMVKQRYPNKPVLVLSNGVTPAEFAASPQQAPRSGIYYFGAINRLSLIETFLRALPATIEAVPDTTVTILGGGNALSEAESLAQELGLADHIAFQGWIKPTDINKYVAYADIGVCTQPDIPTVRAASNLKVFQYMALATVPLVSDVGDLKKYVSPSSAEAVGAVVQPGDQEALSSTLIQLLNDKSGRYQMAKLARVQAETIYSWSSLALALNNFLQLQAPGSKALKLKKVAHDT